MQSKQKWETEEVAWKEAGEGVEEAEEAEEAKEDRLKPSRT